MIKIVVGTAKNFTMGSRINDAINDERFQLMKENDIDVSILFDEYKKAENIAGGIYQKNSMIKLNNKNVYVLSNEKNVKIEEDVHVVNDYMELVEKFKNSKETLSVVGGKIIFDLFTPYANEIFVMEPTIDLPGELIYDSYMDESTFKLVNTTKGKNVNFKTYKRIN